MDATRKSAEAFFSALLELADEYRDESTGYVFGNEREHRGGSDQRLSLYAAGCTLIAELGIPFKNSIQGWENSTHRFENAHLRIRMADGVIRKDANYYPDKQPKVKRDTKYEFDVDGFGDEGWRVKQSDPLIDPKALAVRVVTEFIDFTEANRSW